MTNNSGFFAALAGSLRSTAIGFAQKAVTDWSAAKERAQAFAFGAAHLANNAVALALGGIALIVWGGASLFPLVVALAATVESAGLLPPGATEAILNPGIKSAGPPPLATALINLGIYLTVVVLIFGVLLPFSRRLLNAAAAGDDRG